MAGRNSMFLQYSPSPRRIGLPSLTVLAFDALHWWQSLPTVQMFRLREIPMAFGS
jgi:hypothetical protein